MNRTYIVTGGNGNLGKLLLKRADFHFLDCDINDIESIRQAEYDLWGADLSQNQTIVINLAAMSSIDDCEKDYEKALKVNTHGLANLHKIFGGRVLNISSDQVFSGKSLFLPNEYTKPNPINNYGFTKLGAETISQVFGGKTLRLSRTVHLEDRDIVGPLAQLLNKFSPSIPTFFTRNYMHREFAVDAIEFMVRNWDDMPQMINYGGTDHITMFGFMKMLAMELGLDPTLLLKNNKYDDTLTPRPRNGGFKVGLAEELGFPMYSALQTCQKLKEEFNG